MELMSSVGREAWRKGMEEGRQAGRQAGLQEGRQEGRHAGLQEGVTNVVSLLLIRKFGFVSESLRQRVQALPSADAQALAEELIGNITLADVETWLNRFSAN